MQRRHLIFPGNVAELAECLQRVAGVLTAGTVPIIGLPAIVFRDYIGTFIATFTRFFEDIATFVLDKSGEQLISAHFDRTMEVVAKAMKPGDRLVVSAHSLGSVVVHNYVVRNWTADKGRVPDTVVTFGSPVGLLIWIWLFLDFENMDFQSRVEADHYFCWNPVSRGTAAHKPLSWINVVNCVDPIATAFPVGSLDLSAPESAISASLKGGAVAHRFFGPARVTSVGSAHNQYLNDKTGFVRILLQASGLASGEPEDVPSERLAGHHWLATQSVLRRLQWGLLGAAALAIGSYCWLVGRGFNDYRALWFVPLFVWPPITIGILAFFQRVMLGGPTKRIPTALIRNLKWWDVVAFPYRLREAVRPSSDPADDVDPMAPSPGHLTRLLIRVISFIPTLVAMAIPIIGMGWLTGRWPTLNGLWERLWSLEGLLAFVAFMVYVVCCAGHELARTWRRVVRILTQGPRSV